MKPSKSNLQSYSGSPVSSNSVVWQGPCLSCINLNTGDTVSDVIYKLALDICNLKEQLDLTDLDLKCLFEECALCPEPEKTLSSVLTLLINKVCTLEELLQEQTDVDPETPSLIRVATCFQTEDLNGDLILDLPITDYVKSIGNRVCSILSTVNNHTSTLTNHESRITALEEEGDETSLPKVNPTCVFGNDTTPKDLDEMVTVLEEQFCLLRAATGTPNQLLQAAAKQCAGLNTSPALSTSGNMNTLTGWKSSVTNVADTINNLWLTICDIRTAVDAVQDCCALSCADVTVNFIANVADNGASINLYFSGYTILPGGVTDCTSQGSKLTITDGISGSHIMYIKLAEAAENPSPIVINIASTPLNPTGTYTFTLDSCVTDGNITCNKTVIVYATGTAMSCLPPTNVVVTLL